MSWCMLVAAGAGAVIGLAQALAQASPDLSGVPEPVWEKILNYGVLGCLCAFLLIERIYDRKADRRSRHHQAGVLQENTLATEVLSERMKNFGRMLWTLLGGKGDPPDDDTPRTNRPPPRRSDESGTH